LPLSSIIIILQIYIEVSLQVCLLGFLDLQDIGRVHASSCCKISSG
jgi:hypothetical protein